MVKLWKTNKSTTYYLAVSKELKHRYNQYVLREWLAKVFMAERIRSEFEKVLSEVEEKHKQKPNEIQPSAVQEPKSATPPLPSLSPSIKFDESEAKDGHDVAHDEVHDEVHDVPVDEPTTLPPIEKKSEPYQEDQQSEEIAPSNATPESNKEIQQTYGYSITMQIRLWTIHYPLNLRTE